MVVPLLHRLVAEVLARTILLLAGILLAILTHLEVEAEMGVGVVVEADLVVVEADLAAVEAVEVDLVVEVDLSSGSELEAEAMVGEVEMIPPVALAVVVVVVVVIQVGEVTRVG